MLMASLARANLSDLRRLAVALKVGTPEWANKDEVLVAIQAALATTVPETRIEFGTPEKNIDEPAAADEMKSIQHEDPEPLQRLRGAPMAMAPQAGTPKYPSV